MTQKIALHPSLKKTFKGCEEWWLSREIKKNEIQKLILEIQEYLRSSEQVSRAIRVAVEGLGFAYSIGACLQIYRQALLDTRQFLCWSVLFRAIDFSFMASHLPSGLRPLPFSSSMKAAGPAMLSQWDRAQICAHWLVKVAELEQARWQDIHDKERADGWGKGTNDAFLIYLFSSAFAIPTHYQPAKPLITDYQLVLDHWRTDNLALFQQVMQGAADFHISRSKDGTDKVDYEFEHDIDRVFPAELLAIQALRRRDGLPEFETGHLLIDTPWSMIRDLPPAPPHPLAEAVEARLRHDYPNFR